MIRMGIFSRPAWLVGPLVLAAMASGQDPKPDAKERSVRVTEGRVTIVDDGATSPDLKSRVRTAIRPADPTRVMRSYAPMLPIRQIRHASDPLQAKLGLELAEADDALRAQLQLNNGQGLVVTGIKPGGAAGQSGLKVNDVVVSLGDLKVRRLDEARVRLLSIGKEPIEVKLIRAGQPVRISLAGPDHGAGYQPELTEFWIGVPVTPVDATLRSHLADLPAEAGLIANDVVADSPAAKAGVKKNDILVKFGDKLLSARGDLTAQVQAAGDKPTPLEILRAGKPITLTIAPAKRARTMAFDVNMSGDKGMFYNFVVPKPGVAVADPAKYEAILKEVNQLVEGLSSKSGEKPLEIHLEMLTSKARAVADEAGAKAKAITEEATSKIEASMKELKASIDELKRAVEGLKKSDGK